MNKATPTVSVTHAGGTYNTDPFPATDATVTGVGTDGPIASFGDPSLSYSYYSGATPLNVAPTAAGAYTVVANYTSNNPNYADAHSSAVGFTIAPATPTVSVTDAGGTYNTDPFPATDATVTGVGTDGPIASFGDPSLSYSYYSGATPLNVAPTAAGGLHGGGELHQQQPQLRGRAQARGGLHDRAGDADDHLGQSGDIVYGTALGATQLDATAQVVTSWPGPSPTPRPRARS